MNKRRIAISIFAIGFLAVAYLIIRSAKSTIESRWLCNVAASMDTPSAKAHVYLKALQENHQCGEAETQLALLGESAAKKGGWNQTDAYKVLRQASNIVPDDTSLLLAFADLAIHQGAGCAGESLDAYARIARSTHPPERSAILGAIHASIVLNKWKDAEIWCEKAGENGLPTESIIDWAQVELELSNQSKALSLLHYAITRQPTVDDQMHIGYIYLELGKPQDAIKSLLQARQRAPEPYDRCIAMQGLGVAYYQVGEFDQACKYLRLLCDSPSGYPNDFTMAGITSYCRGDIQSAVNYFRRASRSRFPPAACYAGLALVALHNGAFDEALTEAQIATDMVVNTLSEYHLVFSFDFHQEIWRLLRLEAEKHGQRVEIRTLNLICDYNLGKTKPSHADIAGSLLTASGTQWNEWWQTMPDRLPW